MARGTTLVDEVHLDGGLGFQVAGLPDGTIAIRARVDADQGLDFNRGSAEVFFMVGPQGVQRLSSALAFWLSNAPVIAVETPQAAPTDE